MPDQVRQWNFIFEINNLSVIPVLDTGISTWRRPHQKFWGSLPFSVVHLDRLEDVDWCEIIRQRLDIGAWDRMAAARADHPGQRVAQPIGLLPHREDKFDQDDVRMGAMYGRGFGFGLKVEDMTYYVELGEKIVDREMALRSRMTHHLTYEEDAARTMQMVKNARMCRAYVIDRLFQRRVGAMRDLKKDESRT